MDHVSRDIDLEESAMLAPGSAEVFPDLREGETLKEYLCRIVLAIYERERARLGSHSAVALRFGMRRSSLYDLVGRSQRQIAKSTVSPKR